MTLICADQPPPLNMNYMLTVVFEDLFSSQILLVLSETGIDEHDSSIACIQVFNFVDDIKGQNCLIPFSPKLYSLMPPVQTN